MKTSSFRLYTGPGRISIARWVPRDCPKGFRVFKPLAPGDWSRAHRSWVDYDTFLRGYAQQLAALDPQATYDALTALVAPEEPVLLCWEVRPSTTTASNGVIASKWRAGLSRRSRSKWASYDGDPHGDRLAVVSVREDDARSTA
jgi:hypothetical protein